MSTRIVAFGLLVALLASETAYAASGAGVGSYLSSRFTTGEKSGAASQLAELGGQWTRQEFIYETIGGPTGTSYSSDDEALDVLRAQNIKVLGLLNYHTTPPSVSDWEGFVQNTVTHYASKVDAWEVMNEPNIVVPNRFIAASDFKNYMNVAAGKIRQLDPTAKLVTGAVSGVDISYLEALVPQIGCANFDAIGVHPYRGEKPELVKFGEGDWTTYVATAAGLLRRTCPGKQIWLTEFGYQTTAVTAEQQANFLARSFLLAQTIPEVDVILSYNYRDDSSGDWGIVTTTNTKKTAFNRLRDAIAGSIGRPYAEEVVANSRTTVESFESTAGWTQQFSNNASATLSVVAGHDSNALQANYTFTAASAAVVLTKETSIAGRPAALGFWAKGDNSRNVWYLRFKDNNGETFQAMVGRLRSDWAYYQVDLANTNAMVSWDGDKAIQYPIKFHGMALDRENGISSGTMTLDSLQVLYVNADVHAYRFTDKIAAWKESGSTTATICNQSVTLTEAPTYVSCVNVADTYRAQFISQNSYPTLYPGESYQFEVQLKNNSTATWEKGTVNLGTASPLDRIPGFIRGDTEANNPSGWSTANRVSLVENSVAPGSTGTFRFYYSVPTDKARGVYREYFRPVAEGITWMDDLGIYWDVTVLGEADKYRHQFMSQNSYPTLQRGQSYQFEVVLKNTGDATWQRGSVNFGTSRDRDRIPGFIREDQVANSPSGWLKFNRAQLVESSVAPGSTGTFRFYYTVPSDKPAGVYREYFQMVAEDITWMEDFGIFWDVTVQ